MENAFDQLEDRVKKAAEALKSLRHDNKTLQDELARARRQLQEAEKKAGAVEKDDHLESLGSEVKEMRAEREEIRRRIARMVQVLDTLDPEE